MRCLTAPALATLALCCTTLYADPAADARRAIQTVYASTDAAFRHRDAAGTAAFYAPGYVSIGRNGNRSSAEQERQAAAKIFVRTNGPIMARTVIQTFSLSGPNAAVVTVHEHMAATFVDPRTKEPAKSTFDVTARDFWIKTARGWREKQSKALSEVMTINGRPVPDHSNPAST